jgi:hypothetical protein
MEARTLEFMVYIEGVPVPFTGGSCTATSGGLSSASVTIPYTRYATQLRPRTNVIITYIDDLKSETILFEGDLSGVTIQGSASGRMCQLSLISPLESLRKYRQYVDTQVLTVESSVTTYMNIDSETINPVSFTNESLGGTQGQEIAEVLKTGKFPDDMHMHFRSVVQGKEGSSVEAHEGYHDYMSQFEAIDLYGEDKLWDNFRTDLNISQWMGDMSLISNQSSPDFYMHMKQVYSSMHYELTDIGVPHLNLDMSIPYGDIGGYSNRVSRFMLHPSTPFLNPPACNIVMSDILTGSTINLPYNSEITRGVISKPLSLLAKDQFSKTFFVAPSSNLNEKTSVGKTNFIEFFDSASVLSKRYGNNEYFNPPFSRFYYLPSWYTSKPTSPQAPPAKSGITHQDAFALRYADLKYLTDKYKTRTASVSMIFNPKLVVGFPAVVTDNDQPFFGLVTRVMHSFSAQGSASTSMACSHVTTPLDYMNTDLRKANSISTKTMEDGIGCEYYHVGLGPSFHQYAKAVAKDSTVTIPQEYQPDEEAAKTDEGFSRLVDLEKIMDKILKNQASDSSLTKYLVNKGREPMPVNFKDGGEGVKTYWTAVTSTRSSRKDSYLGTPGSSDIEDMYHVRRRVAELLAKDLMGRPRTKAEKNVENSIFSILDETLCPKTDGEIAGIKPEKKN